MRSKSPNQNGAGLAADPGAEVPSSSGRGGEGPGQDPPDTCFGQKQVRSPTILEFCFFKYHIFIILP